MAENETKPDQKQAERSRPDNLAEYKNTRQKGKDERQRRVAVLLSFGLSRQSISERLGVSRQTIDNDVGDLQEKWRGEIANVDLSVLLGQMWNESKNRKLKANTLYYSTNQDAVKIAALRIQAEEDERIVRLLQSVGVLYKAPDGLVISRGETASAFAEYLKDHDVPSTSEFVKLFKAALSAAGGNGGGNGGDGDHALPKLLAAPRPGHEGTSGGSD